MNVLRISFLFIAMPFILFWVIPCILASRRINHGNKFCVYKDNVLKNVDEFGNIKDVALAKKDILKWESELVHEGLFIDENQRAETIKSNKDAYVLNEKSLKLQRIQTVCLVAWVVAIIIMPFIYLTLPVLICVLSELYSRFTSLDKQVDNMIHEEFLKNKDERMKVLDEEFKMMNEYKQRIFKARKNTKKIKKDNDGE